MSLEINYGNIGRTYFLEQVMRAELESILSKLRRPNASKLTVWIENENPIQSAGPTQYRCTFRLKTPRSEHTVQKKGANFYRNFRSAKKALEKKVRRQPTRANSVEAKKMLIGGTPNGF